MPRAQRFSPCSSSSSPLFESNLWPLAACHPPLCLCLKCSDLIISTSFHHLFSVIFSSSCSYWNTLSSSSLSFLPVFSLLVHVWRWTLKVHFLAFSRVHRWMEFVSCHVAHRLVLNTVRVCEDTALHFQSCSHSCVCVSVCACVRVCVH